MGTRGAEAVGLLTVRTIARTSPCVASLGPGSGRPDSSKPCWRVEESVRREAWHGRRGGKNRLVAGVGSHEVLGSRRWGNGGYKGGIGAERIESRGVVVE